jgi:histidinol dehydrogenase
MIAPIRTTDADFDTRFARLRQQAPVGSSAADQTAREIVAAVRRRGDRALLAYTKKFDRVALRAEQLLVPAEEIAAARAQVGREVWAAMRLAAA